MRPIHTLIPNQPPIELVDYYPSFAQYYPECELQTKRWFVEHVEPDWVMFDAGANVGYYSILFSRLAPLGKIFAFEPTETIDMLRANLKHNGCTNVTPIQIALGSASGAREDSVYRIWGEEPERKVFEFATVDEMISRLDLRRLDCIKIDVDSFDLEVLRGAEGTLRRFDPWIVVELTGALTKRDQSSREALEWLYSVGYRCGHITDDENHIFRRSNDSERPTDVFPSILLSFETQPLIVAPPWRNGPRLDGVFNREPLRHNAASAFAVSDDGEPECWNVTVPGPQWAFAVSWTRSERELPPAAVIVEVQIDVLRGLIGIGCVRAGETDYIGKEVVLRALPVTQTVSLFADRGCDVGYFVVRNLDPNGAPANVRVRAVRMFDAVEQSASSSAGLLSATKLRVSLPECAAALAGVEPARESVPAAADTIDIVPVSELGRALGFSTAFVPEIRVYRHGLADFKADIDESAILGYIYRESRPQRHLEFGTGEGLGTVLCASSSDAEIWTVDAPLAGADSSTVGWQFRQGAFATRIHQVSSEQYAIAQEPFGSAPFDTALIDSGRSVDEVVEHTNAVLGALRPGGLIIWHGFCPDVETLARSESARHFVSAVVEHYASWRPGFSRCFWIRPSWLLVGVKA